jgi:glucokinase
MTPLRPVRHWPRACSNVHSIGENRAECQRSNAHNRPELTPFHAQLHNAPSEIRVVAVDVGGTDTKAALVDGGGTVLAARSIPTPLAGPRTGERVVDLVARLVEELGPDAVAVGLVVPGLVDEEGGRAVWSENLDWRDVPFAAMVSERCRLPTVLGHDVRAGGLAESRLGAARGLDDVLFMPIGTGIAAAIVLGGRLHAGGGYAGETPRSPGSRPCSRPRRWWSGAGCRGRATRCWGRSPSGSSSG